MLDTIGNGHPKQPKMVGRPWGLRVGGLPSLFSGFLPPQKAKGLGEQGISQMKFF